MKGARELKIENLKARLNAIEDERILRLEVLNTEYDALLTDVESEIDARNANRIESEAIDAENNNTMQVKMEGIRVKRAAYDAEKKAYKAARNAAKLELVEARYNQWEIEYDDGLSEATTGSGIVENCSICTEDFVHRKGIGFQLSCAHQFHKICLKPWMKSNNTGPLCRQLPLSG